MIVLERFWSPHLCSCTVGLATSSTRQRNVIMKWQRLPRIPHGEVEIGETEELLGQEDSAVAALSRKSALCRRRFTNFGVSNPRSMFEQRYVSYYALEVYKGVKTVSHTQKLLDSLSVPDL